VAIGRLPTRAICIGEFRYGAVSIDETGVPRTNATQEWFSHLPHAMLHAEALPRGKVLIDAAELEVLLLAADRLLLMKTPPSAARGALPETPLSIREAQSCGVMIDNAVNSLEAGMSTESVALELRMLARRLTR